MLKKIKWTIAFLFLLFLIGVGLKFYFGPEKINIAHRMIETRFEGDYTITCDIGGAKVYELKDSKVTASDKGYYYFWINGKLHQLPVQHTTVIAN